MSRNFGNSNLDGRSSNNTRKIAILILAALLLLVGVAAAIIIPSIEASRKPPPRPQKANQIFLDPEPDVRMIGILIPNRRIEPGIQVTADMFRVETIGEDKVPARAVNNFSQIEGYYIKSELTPDNPINLDAFTTVAPASQITAKIKKGFRAVTISVDERSSVEGWARPGARVDVTWNTVVKGEASLIKLVTNAEVLSAQRQTANDQAKAQEIASQNTDESKEANGQPPVPSTVTLLVDEYDADKIQFAAVGGSLSLQLRNENDSSASKDTGPMDINKILGSKEGDANPKIGEVSSKGADGREVILCLYKNGEVKPCT
jgi:Flp pilus assembly protein CpaB